jgi:hypothetical protein
VTTANTIGSSVVVSVGTGSVKDGGVITDVGKSTVVVGTLSMVEMLGVKVGIVSVVEGITIEVDKLDEVVNTEDEVELVVVGDGGCEVLETGTQKHLRCTAWRLPITSTAGVGQVSTNPAGQEAVGEVDEVDEVVVSDGVVDEVVVVVGVQMHSGARFLKITSSSGGHVRVKPGGQIAVEVEVVVGGLLVVVDVVGTQEHSARFLNMIGPSSLPPSGEHTSTMPGGQDSVEVEVDTGGLDVVVISIVVVTGTQIHSWRFCRVLIIGQVRTHPTGHSSVVVLVLVAGMVVDVVVIGRQVHSARFLNIMPPSSSPSPSPSGGHV